MLTTHPTTGVKLILRKGLKPNQSKQANTLSDTVLFEGQAIIDDNTDKSTTAITMYGISKLQGYSVYIPDLEVQIRKADYPNLELSFNEMDLHQETDWTGENLITLKVVDVFKPNRIILDYTTLICEI